MFFWFVGGVLVVFCRYLFDFHSEVLEGVALFCVYGCFGFSFLIIFIFRYFFWFSF